MADEISHWHTKVVGVSRRNPDGSDRQTILSRCSPLEPLELVPEPDNPADPNAIKVCTAAGQQLGYLSREVAEEITRRGRRGWRYNALLKQITGGGRKTLGANLLILCGPPATTDADAQAYVNWLVANDPEIREQLPAAMAAGSVRPAVGAEAIDGESDYGDWSQTIGPRSLPRSNRRSDDLGMWIVRGMVLLIAALIAAALYLLAQSARR